VRDIIIAAGGGGGSGPLSQLSTIGGVVYLTMFGVHVVHVVRIVVRDHRSIKDAVVEEIERYEEEERIAPPRPDGDDNS
jgi:hypothetical protein